MEFEVTGILPGGPYVLSLKELSILMEDLSFPNMEIGDSIIIKRVA
jgi:hypothetical protein